MASMTQTSLVLFVYILAFVTGVPSNLLALHTIVVKVHQKPSPVGIFLLNLTISDLLLLFFLPFKMVEAASDMTWPMPHFLCPIVVVVYFCSIYISSLFLTAISIERYMGVAHPIKYRASKKIAYAIWVSVFIWVFSALQGSVSVFVLTLLPSNVSHQDRCYQSFSKEQSRILMPFRLEGSIVLFCIPFIITAFCYVSFVRLLMAMPNIRRKRKHRAVCLAVATLFNFTLCFLPYNVSHIVGFITDRSPRWRVYALLLSTLNASIDPIVFYYSSTAVQRAFIKCLQDVKKKLNIVNSTKTQMEMSQFSDTQTAYEREGASNPSCNSLLMSN
ncbi:free fatty acid receptor 2-like [Pseudophryne corroboree]|uniref:free fatty acid receptor 2-like n=1 Tax=Pseudophryne corroboree TaxID=495146 RepID=UPI003081343A